MNCHDALNVGSVHTSPSVGVIQVAGVTSNTDHWRTRAAVLMRGLSKLHTRVRASMYDTVTHPKTTKRASDHATVLPSEWHTHKDNQRLQMCQIPEILLWCRGMCFIFSLSLLNSQHELIRMMPLHTWSPCGKNWVRHAATSRKALWHSVPILFLYSIYLTFFLYGSYITITAWSLLCPVDQLPLTHGGRIKKCFGLNYQTHSTREEATLSVGVKGCLRIAKDLNVTH